MMDMSFFDWSDLGTFAGALAAVALLTELTKSLPGIRKIPTQLFSWLLGCGVLILAAWFTGTLSAQSAALAVLNGAMVSLAANGGYAALKRLLPDSDDAKNPREEEETPDA